jgi:DNA polymerase I
MKTWLGDFEFCHVPGRIPRPWCMVAVCVETSEVIRLWLDNGSVPSPFTSPYRLVAHYALAELTCFLALGWPLPDEVIDTLAEARTSRGQCIANGSWGLLNVAASFGISTMTAEHKEVMRDLAMGESVPDDRREELMDYCQKDVDTLALVWRKLTPFVDVPLAVLRGRSLKAFAAVENRGIPVDVDLVALLRANNDAIKERAWHQARGLYPGVITEEGRFNAGRWLEWCAAAGIPWPRLDCGTSRLDEKTFKEMSDRYPEIRTMTYARKLRAQSRGFTYPVGEDGRLRCLLSPFGSDTGRNQPSNSQFVFGASAWLRTIIEAPPGRVLAYIDYGGQEFALAAALSGDQAMISDYRSGDPYWGFARRAAAVPQTANVNHHRGTRAAYKVAALAIQYGMGPKSLAQALGITRSAARHLIEQHKHSYPRFWKWRQAAIDTVLCGGSVSTRYGWTRRAKAEDKSTSIGNFLIQATGAEILRTAVIALEEAGHRVVATIHDAVLVELDHSGWEEELGHIRLLMSRASQAEAPEIDIRTDVRVTLPGEHFVDPRGVEFWDVVSPIVGRAPHRPRRI